MVSKVVVISGPSGVGKTTICNALLEQPNFARVVTATTRAPRVDEICGVDYNFCTRDEFLEKVEAGCFLEHAEVFGNLYGTPRDAVNQLLDEGTSILLNIDVQGAETLRKRAEVPILTIFLMPPSFADLEERLKGRSTDSQEAIEERLNEARNEAAQAFRYDQLVINDEVPSAVDRILALLEMDDKNPNKPARIILGVMGSISAYKAADLTSKLVQKGHDVHVVMTESASKLVDPNTFLYLSGNRVHVDMFDESQVGPIEHIALPDEAQLIVIAPATANGIGQIAHGLGSNMLTTMLLAANSPVLICPAMNPRMWQNPIVQENVKRLEGHGYLFLSPQSGRLACGHTGQGRLAEPADIVEQIASILSESPRNQNQ
jgi:guanylate kinase